MAVWNWRPINNRPIKWKRCTWGGHNCGRGKRQQLTDWLQAQKQIDNPTLSRSRLFFGPWWPWWPTRGGTAQSPSYYSWFQVTRSRSTVSSVKTWMMIAMIAIIMQDDNKGNNGAAEKKWDNLIFFFLFLFVSFCAIKRGGRSTEEVEQVGRSRPAREMQSNVVIRLLRYSQESSSTNIPSLRSFLPSIIA